MHWTGGTRKEGLWASVGFRSLLGVSVFSVIVSQDNVMDRIFGNWYFVGISTNGFA